MKLDGETLLSSGTAVPADRLTLPSALRSFPPISADYLSTLCSLPLSKGDLMPNGWEVFGEPDNDDRAAWTRRLRNSRAQSSRGSVASAAKLPSGVNRLVLTAKETPEEASQTQTSKLRA